MRFLIILAAAGGLLAQETEVNGGLAMKGILRAVAGATSGLDMSASSSSRPFREVSGAPTGSCTLADGARFDTVGRMLYVCGPGNTWGQISGAVASVFGQTGAITAQAGHYSAFYPLLSAAYSDPGWIVGLNWNKLLSVPATFTPSSHTHSAAETTTGTFAAARLPGGASLINGRCVEWDGTAFVSAASACGIGSGGITVQVGGSALPSQPVSTVNVVPGFGVLLTGTTSAGVSSVQITAEAGPFPFASLPAASANSGRAVIVNDASNCTASAATVAGGGTQSCLVRSNGASWLTPTNVGGAGSGTVTSVAMTVPTGLSVANSPVTSSGTLALSWSGQIPIAQIPTGTTSGTVATGDHTHAGGNHYAASRGRTSTVTPAVNTWTDVYSLSSVPALAAGQCYLIETAMGGTDATVTPYDTRVLIGTGGTQIADWNGGSEKYKILMFSICNDAGTQTTQTVNDRGSGFNNGNNATSGITPFFGPSTHAAVSANLSAASTLVVQVRSATAAKNFQGFYLRISQ